MAHHKGLIILITTVAAMTLAVGLGLFLFLPRSPEATNQALEPQVIRVSVVPEESSDTPPSNEVNDQPPPAAVTSPIEVPSDTGLLKAPPLPIPTAPNQAPQSTVNRDTSPATTTEEPTWTRPTASARTPAQAPSQTRQDVRSSQTTAPPARPASTRPPAGSSNTYWVQVGAFQSQTQAETAASRLSSRGWHATITTFRSGAALLYRVRLGPWQTKQDAETFLNRLKSSGRYENAYVVRGG